MGVFKSLSEVLRGLKRGKPAIKLCPACGSSRIHLSSRFDAWLYVCEKCGYKGPIVMEIEKSALKDNKKKTNPESQS